MSPSSPGYSNFIVFIDGVYSPKIANLFIKKLKNNEFIIKKEYKTQHPSINYVSFIIKTNFEWSLIGVTKSLIQSYVPSVVPIWSLSRIPYYINKIAYFNQVLLHFNVPTPVKINYFNFIVCPCLYKECLNAYYCGTNIQNITFSIFTLSANSNQYPSTTPIHSSINHLNFIFSIYDCLFQISSPLSYYMCLIYYLKCLLSYRCPVTEFWFVLGLSLPGQYQFLINSIY